MLSVRMPAVSGLFYTSNPDVLRREVKSLFDDAGSSCSVSLPFKPKALIAPHAGYIYSGLYAAAAYQAIKQPDLISRVVLLGPSHRVPLTGMALSSADVFSTPLGDVNLTKDRINDVLKLRNAVVDDQPHLQEHSLEVQIPFLQTILSDFEILPIVVGLTSAEEVAAVLSAVWGGSETLIVVSSDLSHYLGYQEACAVDHSTTARIEALDVNIQGDEACGCHAINGLLFEADRRSLSVETLVVGNSGDTAGDRQRVVGYGAYALG